MNEKHLKFGAKKGAFGMLYLPEMDLSARKEVAKMAQDLGEKSGNWRRQRTVKAPAVKSSDRLNFHKRRRGDTSKKPFRRYTTKGYGDRSLGKKEEQIEKLSDEM